MFDCQCIGYAEYNYGIDYRGNGILCTWLDFGFIFTYFLHLEANFSIVR